MRLRLRMASKRPRNEISIAEDLLRYKVTSTPDASKNESDLVKAKENADKAMSRLRRSLEAKNLPAMHDKPTYDAESNRVFNYLDVPKASIDSLASSSGTSTQEFLDSLYLGAKVGGEIKDGGDGNVGNDEKPKSSTSDLKHLKYTVAASDLNSSHRKDLGLALKDEASVLDNAFTQSTGSGFQVDFYIPQEAYQEYYDAAKDAYLAKYACADLADESVQIKINKAASKNFIHDKFANTLKLQRKFRSAETREAKKAAKEKQEEQRKKLEKKYIDAQAKESIQREKLSAKQKADREKLAQQLRKFAAAKHLDLDKLPEASMEGLSENQVEARKNTLIGILGSEKGKDGIPFADVLIPYADVLSKDQQLSLLEQLKADRYVDPEAQRRARVFAAQNGIQLDKADKFGKRTSNKIANSYFNKTGFEASDTYIEDVKQQQIKKLSEKRFKTGKYKGQLLGDILAPYTDGMSTDEQLYALSKFKGNDRGKRNSDIAKGALAVGGLGVAAFNKGISGITKAINNGWRTFKSLTSKVLGTVGIAVALGTQAVSLLRRGLNFSVTKATETRDTVISSVNLGVDPVALTRYKEADRRHGVAAGTSEGAIGAVKQKLVTISKLDQQALQESAPILKERIGTLINNVSNGSMSSDKALALILDTYLTAYKNRTDELGRKVQGSNDTERASASAAKLSSNLESAFGSDVAKLFTQIVFENQRKSIYGTDLSADSYWGIVERSGTAQAGVSGKVGNAQLEIKLKYDNFLEDFRNALKEFSTQFMSSADLLVEKLSGLKNLLDNDSKAVVESAIKQNEVRQDTFSTLSAMKNSTEEQITSRLEAQGVHNVDVPTVVAYNDLLRSEQKNKKGISGTSAFLKQASSVAVQKAQGLMQRIQTEANPEEKQNLSKEYDTLANTSVLSYLEDWKEQSMASVRAGGNPTMPIEVQLVLSKIQGNDEYKEIFSNMSILGAGDFLTTYDKTISLVQQDSELMGQFRYLEETLKETETQSKNAEKNKEVASSASVAATVEAKTKQSTQQYYTTQGVKDVNQQLKRSVDARKADFVLQTKDHPNNVQNARQKLFTWIENRFTDKEDGEQWQYAANQLPVLQEAGYLSKGTLIEKNGVKTFDYQFIGKRLKGETKARKQSTVFFAEMLNKGEEISGKSLDEKTKAAEKIITEKLKEIDNLQKAGKVSEANKKVEELNKAYVLSSTYNAIDNSVLTDSKFKRTLATQFFGLPSTVLEFYRESKVQSSLGNEQLARDARTDLYKHYDVSSVKELEEKLNGKILQVTATANAATGKFEFNLDLAQTLSSGEQQIVHKTFETEYNFTNNGAGNTVTMQSNLDTAQDYSRSH